MSRIELIADTLAFVIVGAIVAVLVVLATPGITLPTEGADPFQPTYGNRAPRPGPTSTPLEPVTVPIEELIIQQNPTCWSGIPGRTCDKEAL